MQFGEMFHFLVHLLTNYRGIFGVLGDLLTNHRGNNNYFGQVMSYKEITAFVVLWNDFVIVMSDPTIVKMEGMGCVSRDY